MPKMKSNKSAAKRLKRTASGGFKCHHAHHTHILTKKSSKRKRGLRQASTLHEADLRSANRMLPYS